MKNQIMLINERKMVYCRVERNCIIQMKILKQSETFKYFILHIWEIFTDFKPI